MSQYCLHPIYYRSCSMFHVPSALSHKFCIQHLFSSVSSFSFIYPTVSSGIHFKKFVCDDFNFCCMRINWLCIRGDSRINEGERGGWGGWGPPFPILTLPIESAIKWPIMDRFQILRCLWKCLAKTLQSIVLEFSKIKLQKEPLEFFKVTIANFGRFLALFRD